MEKLEKLYSSDGIYGDFSYGSPFVSKGLTCAVYITQSVIDPSKKVLCVGSGNGYEAVWFIKKGYDVKILELYHPDVEILKEKQIRGYAQDLPFEDNEFDLYFCCEMMEHVPEELTVPILKEAKRVSKEVFFTIATRDDPPFHTHINIHDMAYWYSAFNNLGYKIISAQYAGGLPISVDNGFSSFPTWKDGVILHAKC